MRYAWRSRRQPPRRQPRPGLIKAFVSPSSTKKVNRKTFDALKSRHDEQWMIEMTAAANYLAFLSGVVNTLEVAAPADGDKLPD